MKYPKLIQLHFNQHQVELCIYHVVYKTFNLDKELITILHWCPRRLSNLSDPLLLENIIDEYYSGFFPLYK